MAKKQRTIQLPADIIQLAEAFEAHSGARFNRQVAAAMLQFLCSQPGGPDPYWMRLTVKLERGDLTIGQVMAKVAEDARISREADLNVALDNCPDNPLPYLDLQEDSRVRHLQVFKEVGAQDDPIAALAACWDRFAAGTPPFKERHPDLADDADSEA